MATTHSSPVGALPHDRDLEDALLGSMLFNRDSVADALSTLGSSDFFAPANVAVFDAIIGLYAAGEAVDPLTVADALARAGMLEAIGGKDYLDHLTRACPVPANARAYATQLSELSALRGLAKASSDGYAAAVERRPSHEVAERILGATYDAVSKFSRRGGVQTIAEISATIVGEIERGEPPRTLDTGLPGLDRLLGGMRPGALVTLAARPSVGKSALALCIAESVARNGTPVLFSSLEMSAVQLGERLLSVVSRVPGQIIQSRQLSERERDRVNRAVAEVAQLPLIIDDGASNLLELRARAQKTAMAYGEIGLVVVDYLQLLTPQRSNDNRSVEVGELSRGLKLLAMDFSVPVLALSQLSRAVEYRGSKRPVLSDLRDSGCLPARSLLLRADTGGWVRIGDLHASGERPLVWSVNDQHRLVARPITNVFATGVKTVWRMRLRSGREVEATANHRFLTPDGWVALEDLAPGAAVASVAFLPGPDSGTVSAGDRSDVVWDPIVYLEAVGEEMTYDATVDETHNFIANGVVAHNSIEQDSDAVLFIYREELYDPSTPKAGMAELLVSKNRHGAIGSVELGFDAQTTRFTEL